MLTYQRHLLKARVGTIVGSFFLMSWALGAGLLIWHASFGTNPVTTTFAAMILKETQY